ncbi:MAG: ATPase, T2SS/T4P/T4SS family [Deltaproteobacteria bacterium]
MFSRADQALAKALRAKKHITAEAFDGLLSQAQERNVSLQRLAVSQGIVSEEECLELLAGELSLEMVDLETVSVDKEVIKRVPVKIASYYNFFPLSLRERTLTVAVAAPLDIRTEDEIRTQLGYEVKCVLARAEGVAKMLKLHYGMGAETIGAILSQAPAGGQAPAEAPQTVLGEEKIEDIEKQAQEASVIKLVNQILLEAYRRRATDIHIEPYRDKVRLRYRIDGVLYDAHVAAEVKRFLSAVLSRIKIMANLNIVEHRLSQDGRAIVKTQDQTLDLRVSFIPTPYGESVVIRILPSQMLYSLEKLGLSHDHLKAFEDLIKKPHGILFVTGPTGSGKTTTLYAALSEINTSARKIITIEDPIEYEMEGITQIQVMPEIGWTFARGLRSMLRHDPDVMMVGEVRDLETAEIAIRVALTGHLVVSTLHTNDAASGVTRLTDIGVEPYLIASSVEAFIAQRLVRVICAGCKEEIAYDAEDVIHMELRRQIAQDMGQSDPKDVKLFRGKGCPACNQTGYFGRTGIYELLLMDGSLRELVVKKAPSAQIKKFAVGRGMRTLRQDGWLKVSQGVTTVEEVLKVTQAEEAAARAAEIGQGTGQTAAASGSPSGDVPHAGVSEGQRVYARLSARVNIRYKAFHDLDEIKKGGFQPESLAATLNVSAGGLLFVSSEPVRVGTFLEMRLELPDSRDPVVCLARVVRTEEIEPLKRYNIAAQYMDITSADRVRIDKFVLA